MVLALALLAQCRGPKDALETKDVSASWDVVYRVLQHPRCVNCHPSGEVPLQGDEGRPHAQNVMRGPEGEGLFAMRCSACHQTANAPGAHLPPGAPHWKLPHPDMPLVFEGLSASELCRQLADRARNGNRTPEQLLEHVADDPLVRWGWNPGEGRSPVSTPHAAFVAAMRSWVEGGCACPP
jgi:hypothetical protein